MLKSITMILLVGLYILKTNLPCQNWQGDGTLRNRALDSCTTTVWDLSAQILDQSAGQGTTIELVTSNLNCFLLQL